MKFRSLILLPMLLVVSTLWAIPRSKPVPKVRAKATAHSVTLSLTGTQPTQPVGVVLTGNNYYRSNTSGGPYSPLACNPVALGGSCVDTNVVPAATYFYVETNLCAACAGPKESVNSNEVTATIPNPVGPLPPVLGPPTVTSLTPPRVHVPWTLGNTAGATVEAVLRQTSGTAWVQQKQLKPTVNSYDDNNVARNKTYIYMVRVMKGPVVLATSLPSKPVTVK